LIESGYMAGSATEKGNTFPLNPKRGRPGLPQTGQSLLEFVLVLPLVLFVLLLLIQFGVGLYAQSVVTGAAQEGARVAAEADKGIGDGISAATRLINSGLGSRTAVNVEGAEEGDTIYIEVKAVVPAFLPFLDQAFKFDFHSRANMLKEGWQN
jgi:hypothetical protein